MALCPTGAVPKPTAPATYWITAADIQSWVGASTYSRLAPWVWNLAEQVVSIPELCSNDPPQPTTITDADVLLASSNPVSAVQLVQKLTDFGKWWVWSQQCQCNNAQGTCSFDSELQVGTDICLTSNPNGPIYVWPGHSSAPGMCDTLYYNFPGACAGTLTVTLNASPGLVPPNNLIRLDVVDGTGNIYLSDTADAASVTCNFHNVNTPTGQPGLHITWQPYHDVGTKLWRLRFSTGVVLPPSPAPPPPVINITVAPYPTPPCSTVADICSIVWNIKNYQNVVQNNTFTQVQPTQYQGGIETIISGQGELDVAQDTLALSVTVLSNPPGLDPEPTDPNEYWNLGWIRTGNTVGWDRKAWIRTSGQRIFPPSQPFTKYAWTLADGVQLNVQQLVPLTPTP